MEELYINDDVYIYLLAFDFDFKLDNLVLSLINQYNYAAYSLEKYWSLKEEREGLLEYLLKLMFLVIMLKHIYLDLI
ncbi:hypothetical protein [Marinitoga lauensis]|uniref:hypothetical protein n=1 Tax=Marinitoga lauensis TaxID=2201189 RepID=UPI0010137B4E|nr:hypothetical protein [Marinitoga lauensis]